MAYGEILSDATAPTAPLGAFVDELSELMVMREQLVDVRTAVKGTGREVTCKEAVAAGAEAVGVITAKIDALEARIQARIEGDPEARRVFEILTSIAGVGLITAAALMCWMPELGTLKNRQAAAPSVWRPMRGRAVSRPGPGISVAGAAGRAMSLPWRP